MSPSDIQLGSDEPMTEYGKLIAADLQERLQARAALPDAVEAFATVEAHDALSAGALAGPVGEFDTAGMGRGA